MEQWYVTKNSLRWNGQTRKWTSTESIVAINVSRYVADRIIDTFEGII